MTSPRSGRQRPAELCRPLYGLWRISFTLTQGSASLHPGLYSAACSAGSLNASTNAYPPPMWNYLEKCVVLHRQIVWCPLFLHSQTRPTLRLCENPDLSEVPLKVHHSIQNRGALATGSNKRRHALKDRHLIDSFCGSAPRLEPGRYHHPRRAARLGTPGLGTTKFSNLFTASTASGSVLSGD